MRHSAITGMKFRIIDLTGRNVFEQQVIAGNPIQNINASSLRSGFYFLKLISDEKVIAIEKLIKE
ncbi:MAG: T9SS type A sorting domain-containing protein [Saprospiraceae bacterium]|nr:T9SS type A sorting domain-containing protein [Saprospiraceae bacterium]